MDEDELALASAATVTLIAACLKRRLKRHPLPIKQQKQERIIIRKAMSRANALARVTFKSRDSLACYNDMIKELSSDDPPTKFPRMDSDSFNELLTRVTSLLKYQDAFKDDDMQLREKLALTLRFLASGDEYKTLEKEYKVSVDQLETFVPLLCENIFNALRDQYLRMPRTEDDWMSIAKGFESKWQFPNCVGAVGGMQVVYRKRRKYNTKKPKTRIPKTAVFVLVDADYNILLVDINANKHHVNHDNPFATSSLGQALRRVNLNYIPSDKSQRKNTRSTRGNPDVGQPEREEEDMVTDEETPETSSSNQKDKTSKYAGHENSLPLIFVADETFESEVNIITPYPDDMTTQGLAPQKRVFNYRLERATQVVPNVFGLLPHRFKVLLKPLDIKPRNTKKIILAVCALHNFLKAKSEVIFDELADPETRNPAHQYINLDTFDHEDDQYKMIKGEWREEEMTSLITLIPKEKKEEEELETDQPDPREKFTQYFYNEGSVPWQWSKI